MTGILPEDRAVLVKINRYVVMGDPVPLARARIGNKGRTMWDSQKQVKFGWGLQLQTQHEGRPLFMGPLHVEIDFYITPPQAGKKLIGKYHNIRPDLDNLIKFVLDVANKILYADDNCIASISCRKKYDSSPRTEIVITQLKEKG